MCYLSGYIFYLWDKQILTNDMDFVQTKPTFFALFLDKIVNKVLAT